MKQKLTLLLFALLTTMGVWATEVTTVATAGTPLTLAQLKALSGTGGHVAFANVGSGQWTNKWLANPSANSSLTLSKVQLYTITDGSVSGKYYLQCVNDGNYRTNGGWGDLSSAENIEFRAYTATSLTVSCNNPISIHNNSGTQWNINYGSFGGALNAWAAYAAYGPFYILEVTGINDETNETLFTSKQIVTNGHSYDIPAYAGWKLVDGSPASIVIDGADAVYELHYVSSSFDYTVAIAGTFPDGTEITVKGDAVANNDNVSFDEAVTESDIDVDFPSGYDYCSYTVSIDGATITINGNPYIEKTNANELEDGYYVIQGVSSGKTGFWYHDLSLADNRLFRMSTTSSPDILSDINHFTGNLKYVWKLTTNQDGSFTLQNVGTDAFAPADATRNINFTGTEPANFVWDSEHAAIYQTNYTHSDMTMYVHCNAPSGDLNLSYWTTGPNGVNTGTGSLVAPRFLKVYDVAILKVLLQQRIDEAEAYPMGTGLNQYTASAEFDAALDAAQSEVANDAATKASLDEACENLETALAGITLNMPAANTFFRVRLSALKVAEQPYLLGELSTVEGHTDRLGYGTDAANANSIWYFDGNNLYNYGRGGYAFVKNSSDHASVATSVDTEAASVVFTASANGELGAYNIKFSGSRYLYGQTDGYADAGGDANGNGYNFNIEEVDALPVTISAAGYATLYSPVALTIPSGIKEVYTASDEGDYLHLEAIAGQTIPANTGVILEINEGTEGSYDFSLTDDVQPINSALTGSVAAIDRPAGSYILATGSKGVAFYKDGASTIPGFKAYLPATTGGAVKAFRFDDDATGIENVQCSMFNVQSPIYNLAGQRINKLQKGINIVKGKKVLF